MKLSASQLNVLIKDYYSKYEQRDVEPSISVGRVRPASKLVTPGVVHFEITETVTNSLGETVVEKTNIGDDIEKIVATFLEDLGYEVTAIDYFELSGQEVSFGGIDVTCVKKSLEGKGQI